MSIAYYSQDIDLVNHYPIMVPIDMYGSMRVSRRLHEMCKVWSCEQYACPRPNLKPSVFEKSAERERPSAWCVPHTSSHLIYSTVSARLREFGKPEVLLCYSMPNTEGAFIPARRVDRFDRIYFHASRESYVWIFLPLRRVLAAL